MQKESLKTCSPRASVFTDTGEAPRRTDTLDIDAFRSELDALLEGEVRFDLLSRALYVSDSSNYRQVPVGVVLPRTIEDVEKAVALCRKYAVPLFSRGAGTSLCGQTANAALCIDFTKYLNKILEINTQEKWARVQPGLIEDHLNAKTREDGLILGPDPATHTHCTIGGMLGNNSCGVHAFMAGKMSENTYEMDILTGDGVRMTVGETSEDELERIIAAGGRKGEIYAGLKRIRDKYADLIRERYPDIPRRVSGYNLDELLPENGFNVAKALVGSEGTCVTILEARIRLIENPPKRALLLVGFKDVFTAGDYVPTLREYDIIALEGLDEKLIKGMKALHIHPEDVQLLPEGKGWLMVEFGGDTEEEARKKARKVMDDLDDDDKVTGLKLFDDAEEEAQIWEIRESALGATAHIPGEGMTWPGWEDAAVAPENVGKYLREFQDLLEKHGYQAALYGHFGQGCIHCRIDFDLMTEEGIANYMKFIREAGDLVVKYRGSMTGEHGDGQSKAMLLQKMFGPELVEAFEEFKDLWDPEGLMNPGKVVRPCMPDENLRLGTDFRPKHPDTYFTFANDKGSINRASLRCVGVGKCRRKDNVFMCPSFQVTHDEKDTTRGRAHMIFEMLRGDLITDGWDSKEVLAALDLCLSCKGCKDQCPVSVDIPTLKAEFLAHHYRHKPRPRPHYSMGLVGYLSKLVQFAPQVANLFSHTPIFAAIAKEAAGVAQERTLPKFANRTFLDWFRHRKSFSSGGEPVVLYPDMFNDHFHPETLKAGVQILERWGFDVHVPHGMPAEMRPLLHYGFLELSKKEMAKALDSLKRYAREDIPIILLEPSTATVFRDELPLLFPDDEDGVRITRNVFLLSEFIDKRSLPLPTIEGHAVFHGHCHQKASLHPETARNTLERMGLSVEEPQKGCCGMAGSFGFEAGHYDMSMKIAEMALLPAVRGAALQDYIIADGFSCRAQISQGASRNPLHMAELIREGFELNEAGYTKRVYRRTKEYAPMSNPETVVITGASAGLGRAIAQEFAKHGANIGLIARSMERLEEAKREVEYLGGQAIICQGDVADPESHEKAADDVEKAFGSIDIWVNNAMVTVFSEFEKIEPEEFQRVTDVTYMGFVHGTRTALKRMLPRNKGVIVQVGSALSKRSIPLQSAYCGAKHGINGFTDSIRSELIHKKSNVHITMVQLPGMNTPQFQWGRSRMPYKAQPVPPIFQPEVAAEAIYWAAHQRRREVDIGWNTAMILTGNKFFPKEMDEYLGRTNYEAQQMDEPEDPNRADNLFDTVPGKYAAHGRFDRMAKTSSWEFEVSKHRRPILLGALALGAGVLGFMALKSGSRKD